MVNHVWTLLCNYEPSSGADTPGYELMDPLFRPVTLTKALQTIRSCLFGTEPDVFCLHYRSYQLVSLLHTPLWESYVVNLDPRYTYQVRSLRWADPHLYQPKLERLGGVENPPSTVVGAPLPPDASGITTYEAVLERTGTSQLVWRFARPKVTQITTTLAFDTDGLSLPLAAAATGYAVRLRPQPIGTLWQFQVRLQPRWSPGQLVERLENAGADAQAALWGSRQPPYDVFANAWHNGRDACTRLAAAVLAYVYRVEERRR